ncbi:MAG TPA: hypothetical protein VLI06_19695 [Solimonas sp.]|nr:hypothetical protein [Solimonas sp.]
MRAIQVFNAVALAAAAAFLSCLGVVTLIYAIYLDTEPRLREDWPTVVTVTSVFAVLSLLAGLAFWGQRRELPWRWPAQALLFAGLAAGGLVLVRSLS